MSCQLHGAHIDKEKQGKDVFVWYVAFSVLFSAGASSGPCFIEQRTAFPLSSGFVGLPCPGEWKLVQPRKGWAPKQVLGHLFCRRGAESETWISGICLYLNLSCLYQLTNHSVKFTCSLSPFPLFLCQWRQSTDIASEGECRKMTLNLVCFHSCL